MSTKENWTTTSYSDLGTSSASLMINMLKDEESSTSEIDISTTSTSEKQTDSHHDQAFARTQRNMHTREVLERQMHLLELSKQELIVACDAKCNAYKVKIKSLESNLIDVQKKNIVYINN